MKSRYILLITVLITITNISFAQTQIPGGYISGTWTVSGSPYLINGEITILNNSTLTIEPGVIVEFQGHYKFIVEGRLLAVGTETDTIVFTINDTTGFSNPDTSLGGWHGIRFNWTYTENDSTKISYCKLQYGKAVGSNWPDQDGGAIVVEHYDKLVISNCLITNNIAGGSGWPSGGGISLIDSDPKITGNTISYNSAFSGGGIQCYESNPYLFNNKFIANSASEGGGIHITNSEFQIDGCDFINNKALNGTGGGIRITEGVLVISNCDFLNNESQGHGGGLRTINCNLLVENCNFGNNASNNQGGAIRYDADTGSSGYPYDAILIFNRINNNTAVSSCGGVQISQWNSESSIIDLYIDNCEFTNNAAKNSTGLKLKGNISDFTISNSYFTANTATQPGAGLVISSGGSGLVSNCLFASNVAGTDGGNWNSGGVSVWSEANVDFMNCTFADNTSSYGAGLTVGMGAIATTTNCIFWGNSTDQIALDTSFGQGGTLTVNYCDVQGGADSVNIIISWPTCKLIWGPGNLDSDPMFEDPLTSDYHLQNTSPCINTAIDSFEIFGTWYYCPEIDIEGNPRPNPANTMPDMGAYESPEGTVSSVDNRVGLPERFRLNQNYPNPFNPTTTIMYSIPTPPQPSPYQGEGNREGLFVSLIVYDLLGREIKTLINKEQSPGSYEVEFWSDGLSSGVYFYKLQSGGFVLTKKMTLLR
ncbi:T9SS type A sorting domain-containing protein [Bacteroidota bacterium]